MAEKELRGFKYPKQVELTTGMHKPSSSKSSRCLQSVLYLGTAAFGLAGLLTSMVKL